MRHAHAAASGTSAEHLSDGLLSKLMSFGGGKPSGSNAAAASSPSGLSPLWSGKTASVAGQQKAAGGGARPRGPLIEELPEAQPTATRTTEMVTVSATPPGTCIQVCEACKAAEDQNSSCSVNCTPPSHGVDVALYQSSTIHAIMFAPSKISW